MDEANEDDRVPAKPRNYRRLIYKDLALLKEEYECTPDELTLGSLGKKLAKVLDGVTVFEEPKRRALATLIGEAGFDIGADELVTHAAVKAASNFVTPLRLMKRAPLSGVPTNTRAVNFDPLIWYCSNKDVTMAGGGGKNGASNQRCRARNAIWKH
jgi:hypothetical protein